MSYNNQSSANFSYWSARLERFAGFSDGSMPNNSAETDVDSGKLAEQLQDPRVRAAIDTWDGIISNGNAEMGFGEPLTPPTASTSSQPTFPDNGVFGGQYPGVNPPFGMEMGVANPTPFPAAVPPSQRMLPYNAARNGQYAGVNSSFVAEMGPQAPMTFPAAGAASQPALGNSTVSGIQYDWTTFNGGLENAAPDLPIPMATPELSPGSWSASGSSSPEHRLGMPPAQSATTAAVEPVPSENAPLPNLLPYELPQGNGTYRPRRQLGPRRRPSRIQAAEPDPEPEQQPQEERKGNQVGQIPGLPQALRLHKARCNPHTGCSPVCELETKFPQRYHVMSVTPSVNLGLPEDKQTVLWEHWGASQQKVERPRKKQKINRTQLG